MSEIVLLVVCGLILLIRVAAWAKLRLDHQEHMRKLAEKPLCNRYYTREREP